MENARSSAARAAKATAAARALPHPGLSRAAVEGLRLFIVCGSALALIMAGWLGG
ncbi:MAG TPA: hypothetical protein VN222_04240 [Novosphingobium sp.]|nr:hypothetical protein [Novosphingobium sp.]